ncbi:MAG: methyltransferase domain-containing protein [Planctomycetia bacterium]|nr:methyltransferase domain-containing protein [Planctomycetia bacterium]
MTITLDIGGEGRHAKAFNLNYRRHKTLDPGRGELIPRLIVGRAEAIPLADQSVGRVIVERTPLRAAALAEIARVLAPGGRVVLVHVPLPSVDRHANARRLLGGRATLRRRRLAGQWVQETCIHRTSSN